MRIQFSASVFLLAMHGSGLLFAKEPVTGTPETCKSVLKTYQSKGWLIQETRAFRICCPPKLAAVDRLPEACEALRQHLQETWLGHEAGAWSPRCDIIVHATVDGYVRSLGP